MKWCITALCISIGCFSIDSDCTWIGDQGFLLSDEGWTFFVVLRSSQSVIEFENAAIVVVVM